MPGFSYSDEVDASVLNSATEQVYAPINVEGSLARTTGALLLNVYPFKSSSFFVCGGAYFGGAKFIKIEGHSDELQQLVTEGKEAGIEIGDYFIPVDKNGNVNGGLKVNSFRPYLGLGFGRAVPKSASASCSNWAYSSTVLLKFMQTMPNSPPLIQWQTMNSRILSTN